MLYGLSAGLAATPGPSGQIFAFGSPLCFIKTAFLGSGMSFVHDMLKDEVIWDILVCRLKLSVDRSLSTEVGASW